MFLYLKIDFPEVAFDIKFTKPRDKRQKKILIS